ncbi:DUF2818 family protein [Castellaniella hirudinis]|uniref:DUF2818 family protein n=1 Tax=Castellaniella hirudinis TaxID=1144617 RepID=UPI0039C1F535
MPLDFSVWLVILGALALSNLPFLTDRPLAPWPWGQAYAGRDGWSRWALGLGFLVLLGMWSWGTLRLVGGAFGGVGSLFFLFKLAISLALVAGLMSVPGLLARPQAWGADGAQALQGGAKPDGRPAVARKPADPKPFIDRFLEALVGYVVVGTVGFTLELDLGNAFAQGWEFYAVTLALFLVLGYPGFVWHYLLHRRRK